MLPGKHHRRALEQAELVGTRELAKGDDRPREGDRTDGRAQEQLQSVTRRNRRALVQTVQQRSRLDHRSHGDKYRRQTDHAVEEGHQFGHLGHLDRLGTVSAIGTTGDHVQQHPAHAGDAAPSDLDDQRRRGQYGDRHAGHAKDVAADRGGRVRKPLECLNKTDARHEVQQSYQIHAHGRALLSPPWRPSCLSF